MRIFAFVALSALWALGHALPFLPTVFLRLACVAAITIIALRPRRGELSQFLAGGPRGWAVSLSLGVFSGVILTAGTYGTIHFSSSVWPELGAHIASVYAENGMSHFAIEWPLTLLIVVAEEWLWRERGPRQLARALGHRGAALLSITLYGLAQIGSGSLAVVAAALILGTVWELMRQRTGSLLAPLVSHLMWSSAILVFPLV